MEHLNKEGGYVEGMSTQCWIYKTKSKDASKISFNEGNGVILSITNYAYKTFVGNKPKGRVVLQVCRNKQCVNPEHLKLGTRRDVMGLVYEKDGVLYKLCTRCERELPYNEDNFYSAKNRTVKFVTLCKKCSVETAIERRNKYWQNTLWHESKRGAVGRNLPFEITQKDIEDIFIEQSGKCYWTGITLIPSQISKYPMKPSVDRLDNSRGYYRDNIVLCCLAANMGRNSATKEDFEKYILELKNNIDISLWR